MLLDIMAIVIVRLWWFMIKIQNYCVFVCMIVYIYDGVSRDVDRRKMYYEYIDKQINGVEP